LQKARGDGGGGRHCRWGQGGGGGGVGEGGKRELKCQLGVDWVDAKPLFQFCIFFLQRCIVDLQFAVELLKTRIFLSKFPSFFAHLVDQLFHVFTLGLLFIPGILCGNTVL